MTQNAAPVDKFSARRVRHGKTRRDHDSGAWRRCIQNKAERAAWSNDRSKTAFPSHTCKGLGNSSKRYKAKAG